MMLLRELKAREDEERERFSRDLRWILEHASKDGENADIHNDCKLVHSHCLSHSEAYRNVLYDLYISEEKH